MPQNIISQQTRKGFEKDVEKIDQHLVVIPETKIVRDFDVVSNKYNEDDEIKVKKELDDMKNHAIEK